MPHRRHAKKVPFTKAQVHVIEKLAKREIEEELPVRWLQTQLTNTVLAQKGAADLQFKSDFTGPTADATKLGVIDTSGGMQYIQLNSTTTVTPNTAAGYERCQLKYLHLQGMVDCGTSESCAVRVEVIQYHNVNTDVAFVPYYPRAIMNAVTLTPDAQPLTTVAAISPDASFLMAPNARDLGFKYKWLFQETLYFDSVQNYALRPLSIKLSEKHLAAHGIHEFDEKAVVATGNNPIYLIVYSVARAANGAIGAANWAPATARIGGMQLTYVLKDMQKA